MQLFEARISALALRIRVTRFYLELPKLPLVTCDIECPQIPNALTLYRYVSQRHLWSGQSEMEIKSLQSKNLTTIYIDIFDLLAYKLHMCPSVR